MIRFGILFTFLGFGSIGLHYYSSRQFALLMLFEPIQPGIGLAVGIAGLVLLGIALVRKQAAVTGASQAAAQSAAGRYTPQPPPGQYPQQQYPQQQAAPQPYPQPGQASPGYPSQQYPQQPPQSQW